MASEIVRPFVKRGLAHDTVLESMSLYHNSIGGVSSSEIKRYSDSGSRVDEGRTGKAEDKGKPTKPYLTDMKLSERFRRTRLKLKSQLSISRLWL